MKIHPASYVVAFALLALGAASVGPWAPSPFTSQTGTNTTAAAWRTALGASGTTGGSLTNTAMVGGSETGVTNSDLTASRAVVSSASKVLASSTVTTTELAHLSGVTGGVQTNLDARIPSASGAATNLSVVGLTVTGQTNTDLTASRVMVTDADKKLTSSSVTATEAGYLSGVTSAIQTQLDSKPTVALTNLALLNGTNVFTGTNTFSTNTVLGTNRVGDFLGEGGRWRRLYIGGPFTNEPASSTPATNLIATITLPPLMSENSQLIWSAMSWRTNVTTQPEWTIQFWANTTNGNLLHGSQFLASTAYQPNSVSSIGGSIINTLFRNLNSFSVQRPAGTNYTTPSPSYLLGWDTTQATNTIYVQLINSSAVGTAPINIEFLEILERY
jgi:hypothetical protein